MKIMIEIKTQRKEKMRPLVHQVIRQGIQRHDATVILHEKRPGLNHEVIERD